MVERISPLMERQYGISYFDLSEWAPVPDFALATDASGSKGFGAFNIDEWFAAPWLPSQQHLGMAYKDLYPIIYPDVSGVLRKRSSYHHIRFIKIRHHHASGTRALVREHLCRSCISLVKPT